MTKSQLFNQLPKSLASPLKILGTHTCPFQIKNRTCTEALLFLTRFSRVKKNGHNDFTLLIASASPNPPSAQSTLTHQHTHEASSKTITLHIQYGDFARPLQNSVHSLTQARQYAANEHQEKMIDGYVKSFETGDMEYYKEGSREWVKDKGPSVESYIGFVETYVDPYGGAR